MSTTLEAMAANITLIETRLIRAKKLAREASDAIHTGHQKLAIGTLLPLQEDLADTDALLKTVLLLHRSRKDPPRRAANMPDVSLRGLIEEWGTSQDMETYRALMQRAGTDEPHD